MEVILVVAIRFGPQNRCEIGASTSIDISQELALSTLSLPSARNTDCLSVCHGKDTDVDCIAISVFRQFCALYAVARAAGKGGGNAQFHDITAEMLSGGWLNYCFQPLCRCKPDGALNICLRRQFNGLRNTDTRETNELPLGTGTAQGG